MARCLGPPEGMVKPLPVAGKYVRHAPGVPEDLGFNRGRFTASAEQQDYQKTCHPCCRAIPHGFIKKQSFHIINSASSFDT